MEKDKSPNHGGALLPPSGRHLVFSAQGNNNNSSLNVKAEPLAPGSSRISESGRFSQDISRMPDNPPKRSVGHRRAHSEILTLPDDISFDSDLGVVGGGIDDGGPSFSDDTEEDLFSMYLDMDKFNYSSSSSTATSSFQVGEFTTAAQLTVAVNPSPAAAAAEDLGPTSNEKWPRIRHQHSQSMDGSSTIKPDMLMSSSADANKSLSAAKLSELALVDPKRAKRIWANRQSAARSKERKMRYIAELERKVLTLETQATSVSAQLTLLQRDTNGLNAENSELKLRLQTMEQQVHLQDVLNEALKEEIQHLKVVTGQTLPNGGGAMPMMMNFPPPSSSFGYPNNNNNNAKAKAAMHSVFTAHQFQHLHIQSQKQQQQFHQQQLLQLQQQQQMQQQRVQSEGDLKMRANQNEHTANTTTTTTITTDRYEA